ncbi:hypothetical protein BJV82DRAFT_599112 [Fennellomyces sp. T-0311]|nr:hypothetical protein BJV82DRAFT_599112 [Fennellomyces sp. T-0311]
MLLYASHPALYAFLSLSVLDSFPDYIFFFSNMSSPSYTLFDFSQRHSNFRNRSHASAILAFQQNSRGLSRSGAIPRKRRTIKDEITAFTERHAHGPPQYPAYLKNTVYALMVQEQYTLYCEKAKQLAQDRVIPPDSFTAALISHDLRLPTQWNPDDKGEFVEISDDCLELTYKGAGKEDADISAVRANYPFRPQCGIFYYEVEIISKGVDGHIGIGFCWSSNSLDRLPGWEEHSWGYHGDDGHLFSGPGTSKPYGPKFGTGDIIGCGFDFRTMSAFYTKNGIYLGTAFQNVTGRGIFPFVGFKTPGERIRANFGHIPFKFDITQYFKDERRNTLTQVLHRRKEKQFQNAVVLDYLLHHGYTQSATVLKRLMTPDQAQDDPDAQSRRDVRLAIMEADVERAITLCNEKYPTVLENNPHLLFRLRCRRFIDMVRTAQRHDGMDVDTRQHAGMKRRRVMPERSRSLDDQEIPDDEEEEDVFRDIMAYGKKLQRLYGSLAEERPEMKSELMAAFSVLAYIDLDDSAVSYLFEPWHAEKLASDLNSAILVEQNRHPTPALERIYRQTATVVNELVLSGNSQAAMLTPDQDCLIKDS